MKKKEIKENIYYNSYKIDMVTPTLFFPKGKTKQKALLKIS